MFLLRDETQISLVAEAYLLYKAQKGISGTTLETKLDNRHISGFSEKRKYNSAGKAQKAAIANWIVNTSLHMRTEWLSHWLVLRIIRY